MRTSTLVLVNRRIAGSFAGACLALASLTGCAAAVPPPAAAAEGRIDMGEDASRVDQWARERFPEVYAGIETSDAGLIVFRKPSAAFDEGLRTLGVSTPVVLRDAPYANAELATLAERVLADVDYWAGQGIEITSVGARADGTAVDVGSPQADRLTPRLAGRYGTTPPAIAEPVGPIVPAN